MHHSNENKINAWKKNRHARVFRQPPNLRRRERSLRQQLRLPRLLLITKPLLRVRNWSVLSHLCIHIHHPHSRLLPLLQFCHPKYQSRYKKERQFIDRSAIITGLKWPGSTGSCWPGRIWAPSPKLSCWPPETPYWRMDAAAAAVALSCCCSWLGLGTEAERWRLVWKTKACWSGTWELGLGFEGVWSPPAGCWRGIEEELSAIFWILEFLFSCYF